MDYPVSDNTPPTFEDLGIHRREATQDTIFGKTRTWSDVRRLELSFLLISFLSLLSTIGLTIYIMVKAEKQDFTLALVLLVNTVICFYYVIHGVMRERPYEIVVFMVACVIVIIYVIINFTRTEGWKDDVKLVRLIAVCILVPVNFIMGSVIAIQYQRSGNLIFRTVGANVELQNACKVMYFCEGLLKLDFQMEMSLIILILRNGYVTSTLAVIVLVVGSVLSIVWLILGYLAIRLKKKYLIFVFLFTSLFEPAYVIYRFSEAGIDVTNDDLDALSAVVFAFSAVAIVVRVVLVWWTFKVFKNFGIGLRDKVFPRGKEYSSLNEHPNPRYDANE